MQTAVVLCFIRVQNRSQESCFSTYLPNAVVKLKERLLKVEHRRVLGPFRHRSEAAQDGLQPFNPSSAFFFRGVGRIWLIFPRLC